MAAHIDFVRCMAFSEVSQELRARLHRLRKIQAGEGHRVCREVAVECGREAIREAGELNCWCVICVTGVFQWTELG